MRFLQITTLVALAAGVSAAAVPSRRSNTASGVQSLESRGLKSPEVWFSEVIAGMDKSFLEFDGKMVQAFKGIKPHMEDILNKMKPGVRKAIKGMKHPEDLKTLKPKIDQAMKTLQPEFDKAAKDKRPREVVMKELKPKVDKAFKDIKPQISKVWNDIKTELYEAAEVVDKMVEAPIIAIALFGFILTHPGWEPYTE